MLLIARMFIGHVILDMFDDYMTLQSVIPVPSSGLARINLGVTSGRVFSVCLPKVGKTACDTRIARMVKMIFVEKVASASRVARLAGVGRWQRQQR